jgi:glycosyltransferase involved in cell wall biosynthesis
MRPGNARKGAILHVLTLNSKDGSYGGPVTVAKEIKRELKRRGYECNLIAGVPHEGVAKRYTEPGIFNYGVKQYSKKYPFSSLFSVTIAQNLVRQIYQARIVHIHLARDLIPFFAALSCILMRIPFVTQSHGMLDSDNSLSKRIIDSIVTKRILGLAKTNIVLTNTELDRMKELFPKAKYTIIPNGIRIQNSHPQAEKTGNFKILFCSRLHQRKRPELFLELAKVVTQETDKYSFTIIGPDGGCLEEVLASVNEISSPLVSYRGALDPDKVLETIGRFDLLILPSEREPFPMIVIESLSVGVPVLVMKDCGLAPSLMSLPYTAVSRGKSILDFISVLKELEKKDFFRSKTQVLIDIARKEFNISSVCDKLLEAYYEQ